jgi:hypothetical protein
VLRVSDLLGSRVLAADGTELGKVREVRVVQDGPAHQGLQAAMRVDALLVGRGAIGGRLGYHHGQVRGPWLLRVVFRGAQRTVRVIPLDAVAGWDDEAHLVRLVPNGWSGSGRARAG